MIKENGSLIICLISFICFYLSSIFGVDYLNIAFIPVFIYLHKKNNYMNHEQKFTMTFKKYSFSISVILLVIFFILRLVIRTDKIYYAIFSSLIVAISIYRGTLQEK